MGAGETNRVLITLADFLGSLPTTRLPPVTKNGRVFIVSELPKVSRTALGLDYIVQVFRFLGLEAFIRDYILRQNIY